MQSTPTYFVAAGEIANDSELGLGDGARVVINDGIDGGQESTTYMLMCLGEENWEKWLN